MKKFKPVLFFFFVGIVTVLATLQVSADDPVARWKRVTAYNEINTYRAKRGLHPLLIDKELEIMADYYAMVCADYGRISHDYLSLSGRALLSGSKALDFYDNLSENLSQSQSPHATVAVGSWIMSPPHNEALLDPDVDYMGLGFFAYKDQDWMYVIYFGRRK